MSLETVRFCNIVELSAIRLIIQRLRFVTDAYVLSTAGCPKRLPAAATSVESMTENINQPGRQTASPDPDVDAIPSLTAIAPAYEGLLEMATERLDGPVQTRVRTWEDGEFAIRVYHGYGPHPQRPDTIYKHVLRYHIRDDETVEGLIAVDLETEEKTLIYRTVIGTDGVCVDAGRALE